MDSLLQQPEIDLATAAGRLRGLAGRARQLAVICLALIGGGALATALQPPIGVPLLIGAAAAVSLLGLCRSDRRRLLTRLVAQGDAWSVDGVSNFAVRLQGQRERRRLGKGLRAAADAGRTGSQSPMMVNAPRADDVGARLRRIADALCDPAYEVTASAVALCLRLLCDAMHSPLYNPHIVETELLRVLDLIERGLTGPGTSALPV